MRLRWMAVLAVALLMTALATDAMAQRRDRDRDRNREWILLGEQAVGFRVDRDVIRIGQTEDWYRDRSFRRLHLVAEGNDIHLINVRLVYFNGFGEDYRVDRLLREGEDQAIELRGDRSFVRQLELTYRARPGFGGRAVMKVYGEPSRRGPPGGPPPIISGPGPGSGGGAFSSGLAAARARRRRSAGLSPSASRPPPGPRATAARRASPAPGSSRRPARAGVPWPSNVPAALCPVTPVPSRLRDVKCGPLRGR